MHAPEPATRPPFAREPMAPAFGAVFRSTDPGADPALLDAHADTLRAAVRDSGAILVFGFGFDVPAVEAFCTLFSDRALVHPSTALGGREPVTKTTATVDSGSLPFPWHAELGYAPHRPDLVVLACERPAAEGGETLLTDGCAIADRLSDATRAVASGRIRYRYVRERGMWHDAFGGARSREEVDRALRAQASCLAPGDDLAWSFPGGGDDVVRIDYTTPMLSATRWSDRRAFCNHVIWQERRRRESARAALDPRRFLARRDGVTLEAGGRVPAGVVDEVERLADDGAYAIQWRAGDVAVIDNSRVMHARGHVSDPARRILARMCEAAF